MQLSAPRPPIQSFAADRSNPVPRNALQIRWSRRYGHAGKQCVPLHRPSGRRSNWVQQAHRFARRRVYLGERRVPRIKDCARHGMTEAPTCHAHLWPAVADPPCRRSASLRRYACISPFVVPATEQQSPFKTEGTMPGPSMAQMLVKVTLRMVGFGWWICTSEYQSSNRMSSSRT